MRLLVPLVILGLSGCGLTLDLGPRVSDAEVPGFDAGRRAHDAGRRADGAVDSGARRDAATRRDGGGGGVRDGGVIVVDAAMPDPCSGMTCPAPGACCGGVCVDLGSDRDHCGGCGTACPFPAACRSGSCRCGTRFCGKSETCCLDTGGLPGCFPVFPRPFC